RRAIPHFVRLKKLRIKFLQDQGYQGIVNPDGLSRAEEQFAKDNDWFLTTSGLGQERLDTIYEEKRRHDIYNVINHRARLGQLSSGVI
ncbi:hypothetical protein N9988_00330, partial [bacterium]|nr:hypothetical protein [bacterium]